MVHETALILSFLASGIFIALKLLETRVLPRKRLDVDVDADGNGEYDEIGIPLKWIARDTVIVWIATYTSAYFVEYASVLLGVKFFSGATSRPPPLDVFTDEPRV